MTTRIDACAICAAPQASAGRLVFGDAGGDRLLVHAFCAPCWSRAEGELMRAVGAALERARR